MVRHNDTSTHPHLIRHRIHKLQAPSVLSSRPRSQRSQAMVKEDSTSMLLTYYTTMPSLIDTDPLISSAASACGLQQLTQVFCALPCSTSCYEVRALLEKWHVLNNVLERSSILCLLTLYTRAWMLCKEWKVGQKGSYDCVSTLLYLHCTWSQTCSHCCCVYS
jgi:hypothetical protein